MRKKQRVIRNLAAVAQKEFVKEHGITIHGRRWLEVEKWEEIIGKEEEWDFSSDAKYTDDMTGFPLDGKEIYNARKK